MAGKSYRRSTFAAFALAALVPPAALSQTAAAPAAAPEPDWSFTGNLGLYSQYVFRGISQTNEKPAVQGGFDLGHKSGFYVGTWASNISWISDAGTGASASMEWDFYGGYKGSLPADFTYDLGVLYYWYPGSYPSSYYATGAVSPNTTELYAALGWKFLTLKYSWSANNRTFGINNSRGSSYLDLTASYDVIEKVSDAIGKVTIFGHVGKQWFHNNGFYDYSDWKIGASTEIYGVTVGIYGTGTNAEDAAYTNVYGKNISGGQFVGYLQKTF
ncbi:MAG: TorF family putative porin [Betaproteobacteria bacterium]